MLPPDMTQILPPYLPAAQAVRVDIVASDGTVTPIGTAAASTADKRLSAGDRQAVANVVDAVAYTQRRFGYHGFDDAQNAVHVYLHAEQGPAQLRGHISVPAANVFGQVDPNGHVNENVLLPRDAAQHELGHFLQEHITGKEIVGNVTPDGNPNRPDITMLSVAEGIADSFNCLAMRSWTTGAEFFTKHSKYDAVRDYDHNSSPRTFMPVADDYHKVHRTGPADAHIAGGPIVLTMRGVQQKVGWIQAEDVMWNVMNDPDFASSSQTWGAVSRALKKQADNADFLGNHALASAIRTSMAATSLDSA